MHKPAAAGTIEPEVPATTAFAAIPAIVIICMVLVDAFEAVVLPRRVSHAFRISRWYYTYSWRTVRWTARRFDSAGRRESIMGVFGPLSLIVLFVIWAGALVLSFALLYWAAGSNVATVAGSRGFGTDLFFSGTTFFTLGLGDVVPLNAGLRTLAVVEAAMGFGYLALVISYLPVLYQAFARREQAISLMDSRAGSPPSAVELLSRANRTGGDGAVRDVLADWERWAADLMESHLSYPVLAYFRSHHDRQSWVGALTAVLDTSALIIAIDRGPNLYQAHMTFAIARHAAVDIGQIFSAVFPANLCRELPDHDFEQFVAAYVGPDADVARVQMRFDGQRMLYERYVGALAERFELPLPPLIKSQGILDDWETVAAGS